MTQHSLHPDDICISSTELCWKGRRAKFNRETSPQDLARAYREYHTARRDFTTWVEGRAGRGFTVNAQKEWQTIRRRVLETMYLFEDMTDIFVEIYSQEKLPFDDLASDDFSVLLYGAIDGVKDFLRNEVESRYDASLSKDILEAKDRALAEIASPDTKSFSFTFPDNHRLYAKYSTAYICGNKKIPCILKLI